MLPATTSVLIVGGGPFGLMLANELGRRGIQVCLVDQKPGTSVNPQANATQARTMEHFRRLGFADEVRALEHFLQQQSELAPAGNFLLLE